MQIAYIIIAWIAKNVVIPILIAGILIFISSLFFIPKIKFKIDKIYYKEPNQTNYVVTISNLSNQNIENLIFSIKFDEKYPIKNYTLQDVSIKSGLILRSKEDFVILDYGEPLKCNFLVNGFRGSTDKFPAGTTVVIHVTVDNSYDGAMGDILPPSEKPNLPTEAYYVKYMYKPIGLFSNFYFKRIGYYNFAGKKTQLNNTKNYKQRVRLPNGEFAIYEFS